MAVFSSCISSWNSSSIWAWVAHIVWASLVQFCIKLCVWIEVCKATPVMAAVVQIVINSQMPRISHPMNRLDHRSSLVSYQKASPAMGPSSQCHWRFTGNHKLRWDRRNQKVPESSSSSQGISLKGWVVSVSHDAASHLVFLDCIFISRLRFSVILLQKH